MTAILALIESIKVKDTESDLKKELVQMKVKCLLSCNPEFQISSEI